MASPDQPTLSIKQAYHGRTHASTTDSEGIPQLPEDQKIFQAKKFNIKILVVLVKLLLFVSVLTCLVFNKLTLIKIIADLHMLSNFSKNGSQSADQYSDQSKDSTLKQTANLYWILFFIVLVPNIITWIWSLFSGVMKKSSHCPWPKYTAIIGVSIFIHTYTELEFSFLKGCVFSIYRGFHRNIFSILHIYYSSSRSVSCADVWSLQHTVTD